MKTKFCQWQFEDFSAAMQNYITSHHRDTLKRRLRPTLRPCRSNSSNKTACKQWWRYLSLLYRITAGDKSLATRLRWWDVFDMLKTQRHYVDLYKRKIHAQIDAYWIIPLSRGRCIY